MSRRLQGKYAPAPRRPCPRGGRCRTTRARSRSSGIGALTFAVPLLAGCLAVLAACTDVATGRASLRPVTIAYRADGASVELDAWLYRPAGSGPFPAQVLMHGCSGVEGVHHVWAGRLARHGQVALVVDGLGRRGLADVCGQATFLKLSYWARVADAYAAARFLRHQPDVDPARVGVIGWSHGGIIALRLAEPAPRSVPGLELPIVPFRSAVAFYPYCGSSRDVAVPLLVLIGAADDWTPAANCRGFERLQRLARRPVELVVYAGATHSFDEEGVGDGLVYLGHLLRYDAAATRDAERRLFAFLARAMAD
jgi:dienelactone hydrolase